MESTLKSKARGTVFKDSDERRAAAAKESARLWRAVRAATKVVDESRVVSRGVYEISPEAFIALKHHCEELRVKLAQHDRELAQETEE